MAVWYGMCEFCFLNSGERSVEFLFPCSCCCSGSCLSVPLLVAVMLTSAIGRTTTVSFNVCCWSRERSEAGDNRACSRARGAGLEFSGTRARFLILAEASLWKVGAGCLRQRSSRRERLQLVQGTWRSHLSLCWRQGRQLSALRFGICCSSWSACCVTAFSGFAVSSILVKLGMDEATQFRYSSLFEGNSTSPT